MDSTTVEIRLAYDQAAEAYAEKYQHELDQKPLDREWLQEFATLIGPGRPVLDLGCGPGYTTAHLNALGLDVTGLDLSPAMIAKAAALFPTSRFIEGDFAHLPFPPASVSGIVAFYCIVHLAPEQLPSVFAEMARVLEAGGIMLLAFHVGTEVVRASQFLGTNATLDFTFFEPVTVTAALESIGITILDIQVREPYDTEYPSRRCYLFARKRATAE